MEKTTLKERIVSGLTEEERYDVLLSLALAVGEGKLPASPEEILADGDLRLTLPEEPGNLAVCPPEYIDAVLNDAEAKRGPEQAMFMLGMLCYCLYLGKDYYTDKGLNVLEQELWLPGRSSVIDLGDVAEIPFGKAVVQLTAVEPDHRAAGMRSLLQFFTERVPGTAKLVYEEDGKQVGTAERSLRADIDDLHPSGRVRLEGRDYRIVGGPTAIPYRPGTHVYRVKVRREGAGPSAGEKRTPAARPYPASSAGAKEEVFSQDVMAGRWLYADSALLPRAAAGGEAYFRVLSLNMHDAAFTLELVRRSPAAEFPVVVSERGSKPRVVKRLCVELPEETVKLRFVYHRAEDAVEVRTKNERGEELGTKRFSLGSGV